MEYRRSKAAGGTYFFTVNLADRSSTMLADHIDTLRRAVKVVKQRHPFDILAWVVLPEHMHAIWTLPPDDDDFSTRWMLIKTGFSRIIQRGESINASRLRKGERGIWQRRFRQHQIRDENDLACHIDYVHINPVKHGHAGKASDWPYSSIPDISAMAYSRVIGQRTLILWTRRASAACHRVIQKGRVFAA